MGQARELRLTPLPGCTCPEGTIVAEIALTTDPSCDSNGPYFHFLSNELTLGCS